MFLQRETVRQIQAAFDDSLGSSGLVMRVLEPARLGASAAAALDAAWRSVMGVEDAPARVLVVVNRGGAFWRHVNTRAREPIDTFSRALVERVLDRYAGRWRHLVVYPGDCPVSLQTVGAAAGLGVPSWLGLSIHPEWGSWFAFRALVLTSCPLPAGSVAPADDVCAGCSERPCVKACPVAAPGTPFGLSRCADFRLAASSPCRDRCAARYGCPVGASWRYPESLVGYLYRHSLDSLAAWRSRA